jgi:uncharacterized membrane protein
MFEGSRRRRPGSGIRRPRLLDLTFGQYSSVQLMKVLYFAVIVAVSAVLVGPASYVLRHGFDLPEPERLRYGGLVIGLLLSILAVRVLAECVIVIFRIAEDLKEVAKADHHREMARDLAELVKLNHALIRRLEAASRAASPAAAPANAAPSSAGSANAVPTSAMQRRRARVQ